MAEKTAPADLATITLEVNGVRRLQHDPPMYHVELTMPGGGGVAPGTIPLAPQTVPMATAPALGQVVEVTYRLRPAT